MALISLAENSLSLSMAGLRLGCKNKVKVGPQCTYKLKRNDVSKKYKCDTYHVSSIEESHVGDVLPMF